MAVRPKQTTAVFKRYFISSLTSRSSTDMIRYVFPLSLWTIHFSRFSLLTRQYQIIKFKLTHKIPHLDYILQIENKQMRSKCDFFKYRYNFFAEVRGLRDAGQVETLQDQAQLMLSEYTLTQYPTNKVRFGKILLLLPALRTVSPRTIEDAFFRRTIGSIPIERLLCDMFKSSWRCVNQKHWRYS